MESTLASERIGSLYERANRLLSAMRSELADDINEKTLEVRFSVRQAAELVGRSETSIRRAENEGSLSSPARRPSGHRLGYSLEDINKMRDFFGTRPWRAESDDPIILGVQNFKGGVGKSTLSVHAAQYFALQGYRVLLIDADPQASTTSMLGIHPERDISAHNTLLPYIEGEHDTLAYAVRSTYWDGLDLIPACLGLYDAEYIIAGGQSQEGQAERFDYIKNGLFDVQHAYDLIVIDPPPALGMISLNVLRATNALLVPTPPSSIDYASTVSFLSMLSAVLGQLEKRGILAQYKFVQLVATKVNENKSAHLGMRDAMKDVFGSEILSTALLDSAEFDNANVDMRTIYEYAGASNSTYKRCRSNLDKVLGDLEMAVRNAWPSHRRGLRRQGVA